MKQCLATGWLEYSMVAMLYRANGEITPGMPSEKNEADKGGRMSNRSSLARSPDKISGCDCLILRYVV